MEQGCWFGVGPAMLGSSKGRALVDRMPRERVLTESDGPFAQFDGRSILPWEASFAVLGLSAVWAVQPAEAEQQLAENLMRLGSAPF